MITDIEQIEKDLFYITLDGEKKLASPDADWNEAVQMPVDVVGWVILNELLEEIDYVKA